MKKLLRIVGALLVVLVSVLAVPVRAAAEPTPPPNIVDAAAVSADLAAQRDAVIMVGTNYTISDVYNKAWDIEQRTVWIDNRVQDLQARSGRIETAVGAVNTAVSELKTAVAGVRTSADSALQRTVWIDNRVQGLETSTATIKTDAAAAKKNSLDAYQRTVWIDGKVDELKTAVAGISTGGGGSGDVMWASLQPALASQLAATKDRPTAAKVNEWLQGVWDRLTGLKSSTDKITQACAGTQWWTVTNVSPSACPLTQADAKALRDEVRAQGGAVERAAARVEAAIITSNEASALQEEATRQAIEDGIREVVQGLGDRIDVIQQGVKSAIEDVKESFEQWFAGDATIEWDAGPGELRNLRGWTGAPSCLVPPVDDPSMCGFGPTIMLGDLAFQPLSYCGDLSMFALWKRIFSAVIVISATWLGARWIIASLGIATPES